MLPENRVVITALGVLAPNGIGTEAFWASILERRSGIGPITLFDASDLPCRIAGEVKDFFPLKYIDPILRPERRMGRAAQLGLAAAQMALKDSGLTPALMSRAGEIPVIMGVSSSALELREKPPASWIPVASIPHIIGSLISHAMGVQTRILTVSTGCASGLDAAGLAADEIRRGKADIAIAGAADSVMSRFVFECFCRANKLSKRNDDPSRASRPFDRDRDGGVAAEGAGVVIMESLRFAAERGAVPRLIMPLVLSHDAAKPVRGLIALGRILERQVPDDCSG